MWKEIDLIGLEATGFKGQSLMKFFLQMILFAPLLAKKPLKRNYIVSTTFGAI